MNDEVYNEWADMVYMVARATVRDFPDCEVDDLTQDIWEGLLVAQSKGAMSDPNGEHARSGLFYLAKTAAWKVRKEHLTLSVQYGYRTANVRDLLETFFDREEWVYANFPPDADSELNNVGMEMSADLSRAWDKLIMPHKVLIFQRFGLKEKVDSKKLSKAIARMAEILNTYQVKPDVYTGKRRVITNSASQYRIKKDVDGEQLTW